MEDFILQEEEWRWFKIVECSELLILRLGEGKSVIKCAKCGLILLLLLHFSIKREIEFRFLSVYSTLGLVKIRSTIFHGSGSHFVELVESKFLSPFEWS